MSVLKQYEQKKSFPFACQIRTYIICETAHYMQRTVEKELADLQYSLNPLNLIAFHWLKGVGEGVNCKYV